MIEEDIDVLGKSDTLKDLTEILQRFLTNNVNVFEFPSLEENNRRVLLWTAIFQHLQKKSSEPIHDLCLSALRVLSRDKAGLDKLYCEKWVTLLVEKSGLYNYISIDEASTPTADLERKEVKLEALKCLCNSAFNSEVVRALCAHTGVAEALIGRLRVFKDVPNKDEVMLYDMKLLFILTAFRADVNKKVTNELHGLDYLTSGLKELLVEASIENPNGAHAYKLQDHHQAIACEILKIQYNLIVHTPQNSTTNEVLNSMYLKLMPILTTLLNTQTSNESKLMELHSNVANLLTSIPKEFYPNLTPELEKDETCLNEYDGKHMDALQSLVGLLRNRLINCTKIEMQFDELSPILTVMLKSVRSCRTHRKYLRQVVLPPLRDVSMPPEKGDTLRNMLCRLLTTPITSVRDLVAEFLFILCKEKVDRLVKYTGFGNAAGHLAQKGLLAGGRSAEYSSSDDSDTEEYREAQAQFDPVVGCTRPPRANPFEGMTEEQKEHEAMKLVNLFDKMVREGAVRPAIVGPDGRPQPLEHVLELRENAPNRPQS